jgi:hypothetical protein
MSPGFPAEPAQTTMSTMPDRGGLANRGRATVSDAPGSSQRRIEKPEIGRQDEIHEVFRVTLHELAEPLTAIAGYVHAARRLLKSEVERGDPGSPGPSRRHQRKRTGPTKSSSGA